MRKIKIYNSINDLDDIIDSVLTHVTVGVFDGIHLGHRELLRRTVESAKGGDAVPAVLNFPNHPLSVLAPAYAPPLLTTDEMRIQIFSSLGIKMAAIVKFDHSFSDLSSYEFALNCIFLSIIKNPTFLLNKRLIICMEGVI